jgi:protein phosphatase
MASANVLRLDDHGPFDVIGDVHGCSDELRELLVRLGYTLPEAARPVGHPQGRTLVFLGDVVDRGPGIVEVLRLVMDAVQAGSALCVIGNHEWKLVRALWGRNVKIGHGLAETLAQLGREPEAFRERVARFIEGLPSHFVLDGGRLVVAHGGLKEHMHGKDSEQIRAFAMYGDTTGEFDAWGMPVRLDWAEHYRGKAAVVYGHTPVHEPEWQNNTINIDTGCVFGGRLTALRYPERELVSVQAKEEYFTPGRPFLPDEPAATESPARSGG